MIDFAEIRKALKRNRYEIYNEESPTIQFLDNAAQAIFPIATIILSSILIISSSVSFFKIIILLSGIGSLMVYLNESQKIKNLNIDLNRFIIKEMGIVMYDMKENRSEIQKDLISDIEIIDYDEEGLAMQIENLNTGEIVNLMKFDRNNEELKNAIIEIAQIAIDLWKTE